MGKNQFYKIPERVVNFLQFATFLVEAGGDLIKLRKHGGWKLSTAAEECTDESVVYRTEIK